MNQKKKPQLKQMMSEASKAVSKVFRNLGWNGSRSTYCELYG